MKRCFALISLLLPLSLLAAPKAELWPRWQAHQASNPDSIDHSVWSTFLKQNLITKKEPHLIAYGRVSMQDKQALQQYLDKLQAIVVSRYSRDEQMAYWINLYNAATVDLILDHYPIKSITKIKDGFFSFGPWNRKILKVEGEPLSLNDIEHRILRPIFKDARIHYAVNCASIGCPSLAARAYKANNLEGMLDKAARRFVNHPRAAHVYKGSLKVSSIYEWFKSDFGGTDQSVIAHLIRYAKPDLRKQLRTIEHIDDDEYDWALNDSP